MNFGLLPATSAVPFAKATFERPIRAWTTPPRRERHSVARKRSRIMNNVAPLREQIVTKLYSAVLSDALDAAGHPRQAMRPFLRPLDDSLVLFGRVRTGLYANSYHVDLSKNPYAVEIALVDDLQSSRPTSPSADGPTSCDPKMTTALLCGDFMVELRGCSIGDEDL